VLLAHCAHAALAPRVHPLGHKQSVNKLLPAGDIVVNGHGVQTLFPFAFLYVPGEHAKHDVGVVPVHPALHTHSLIDMLVVGEYVFGGHDKHSG